MRIITHTCSDCGTITAGNVLESRREMKCPGKGCENIIKYSDLAADDRAYILNNRDIYAQDQSE